MTRTFGRAISSSRMLVRPCTTPLSGGALVHKQTGIMGSRLSQDTRPPARALSTPARGNTTTSPRFHRRRPYLLSPGILGFPAAPHNDRGCGFQQLRQHFAFQPHRSAQIELDVITLSAHLMPVSSRIEMRRDGPA